MALAALAFAGQAFAAYTPKLAVQMGTAGTTIHLTIPSTDDPTALLVFYAPAGHEREPRGERRHDDRHARREGRGGRARRRNPAADGHRRGARRGRDVPLERRAGSARCGGDPLHRHGRPRRLLGAEAQRGRADARGAAVRRPGLGSARGRRGVLPDGLPAAVRHPGEPRRRRVRREGVRGELHRQGRLHGHLRPERLAAPRDAVHARRRARRTPRPRSSRSRTSRPGASRSARSSAC